MARCVEALQLRNVNVKAWRGRGQGVPVSTLCLVLTFAHPGKALVALGAAGVSDTVKACGFGPQALDARCEL